MAYRNTNNFPSQVVPDIEKISYDYGLKLHKLSRASGLTETKMATLEVTAGFIVIKTIFII